MNYRTARLTSFEEYLKRTDESAEEIMETRALRDASLERFPWPVMLELAYPEMDFASRWCWKNLGPHHGECYQSRSGSKRSDYPACEIEIPHCHTGNWAIRWFVKTDYDFGFAEWYFSTESDRDRFLQFEPEIHWGEKYPG